MLNNNEHEADTVIDENEINKEKKSNELDLPLPQKENEVITTGNKQNVKIAGNEKEDEHNKNIETYEKTSEDNVKKGDNRINKTGFDPNAPDKNGIHKQIEKEDPEKSDNPAERKFQNTGNNNAGKTGKNADWQQDKINEANNETGGKTSENSAENFQQVKRLNKEQRKDTEKLKNMRDDSILNRPKTETYESNEGENVGEEIRKRNKSHQYEEAKREIK